MLNWLKNKVSQSLAEITKALERLRLLGPRQNEEPDEDQLDVEEAELTETEETDDTEFDDDEENSSQEEETIIAPRSPQVIYYPGRITQIGTIRPVSQAVSPQRLNRNREAAQGNVGSDEVVPATVVEVDHTIRVAAFPKVRITSPERLFSLSELTNADDSAITPKQPGVTINELGGDDISDDIPQEGFAKLDDDLFSWVARQINDSKRTLPKTEEPEEQEDAGTSVDDDDSQEAGVGGADSSPEDNTTQETEEENTNTLPVESDAPEIDETAISESEDSEEERE